ncbi:DUF1615 domain-containing protein [uncultured Salinisphaera sp.]|uniref:DUF1615 domain-containing protein n=1 Tax=uncultured Salinisphaera sp. TaxID=359372 RepID=UPI0032B191AF
MSSVVATRALRAVVVLNLLWLAGCAVLRPTELPRRPAAEVRAELVSLMPAGVDDRAGWAADIETAFAARHIEASSANLCATLSVIAQESSFRAAPVVPGLSRIARGEIERRAAAAHIPDFLLDKALSLESANGQSYDERLDTVRTESDLSDLFEEFIARVPLGSTLFGGFNPVQTGGPMQVAIDFAEQHADDYPYDDAQSLRAEVFSRRGGLYFGIVHLLGYDVDYPSPLYRFADYNAGWYASRNAAFQRAVSQLTGTDLALDGDLISYRAFSVSNTERATKSLSDRLDMGEGPIRRDLTEGSGPDFERTRLYKRVYALADKAAGERVARVILPGIKLESPKISRDLTTAWFAERVYSRWQACMGRAGRP